MTQYAPAYIVNGLGFALGALTGGLIASFFFFSLSLSHLEPSPQIGAEAIVVLTGDKRRIRTALALLERGAANHLLISGVNSNIGIKEMISAYPDSKALFGCCVDLDQKARNTSGNAEQTNKWIRNNGYSSFLLVTHAYHMPRARMEMRALMPDIHVYSYPIVTPRAGGSHSYVDWGWQLFLAKEYIKYQKAILVHWWRNRQLDILNWVSDPGSA